MVKEENKPLDKAIAVYVTFLVLYLFWINTNLYLDFLWIPFNSIPVIIGALTISALYYKRLQLLAISLIIIISIPAWGFYKFSGVGCIDAGQGYIETIDQISLYFTIFSFTSLLFIILKNFKKI